MRQGVVYLNKERVGIITELSSNEYKFRYDDEYFNDPSKPSISLTLTKQQQEYTSHYLFPFFANMLSEGHNRIVQARLLQIDEKDDFGILLATAHTDTAGAVTIYCHTMAWTIMKRNKKNFRITTNTCLYPELNKNTLL